MDDRLFDLLKILMATSEFDEYEPFDDIPEKYIFDEKLNDCLFYMYIYMLSEDDPKHEEYYREFCIRYEALDEERQLVVKNNFENIIKAQDENEKGKEKVKKKGNDKYE